MLSDDKLIDQIKYGNERAAEELITRYYASMLQFLKGYQRIWQRKGQMNC